MKDTVDVRHFIMPLLCLLLLAVLGCTHSEGIPTNCEDKQCFIAAAQNCNPADVTVTESYATVHYVSDNNCVLTKSIMAVSDSETPVMKRLFLDKSMSCSYTQDTFDERWVNTLTDGIEKCQGDLKDTIGDIILLTA